jgi:hypothetical protein
MMRRAAAATQTNGFRVQIDCPQNMVSYCGKKSEQLKQKTYGFLSFWQPFFIHTMQV